MDQRRADNFGMLEFGLGAKVGVRVSMWRDGGMRSTGCRLV